MPLTSTDTNSVEAMPLAHALQAEVLADRGDGQFFRVVYKYAPGGAFWRCDVLAACAEDARDAVQYAQRQDGTTPLIYAVIPLVSVL